MKQITRRNRGIVGGSRSKRKVGCRDREYIYATVNVADPNPPLLPVVKRLQRLAAADVNLWKRRSGGWELKTLQYDTFHGSEVRLQFEASSGDPPNDEHKSRRRAVGDEDKEEDKLNTMK
ncbi:hypothetical protein Vadar_005066 [Vaccinium darrowii]|uniref:Uncharacterized protein n=1 Tax=Vaccinium darrowii TaxID=229202 RepID=A0ACB7YV56_9ERIC|nr:hypothetical protein Vadar_005066 [Vaccinium darrowii]